MDKHECDEEHMDKYECKECGSEDNPPHFDDSEFDGDLAKELGNSIKIPDVPQPLPERAVNTIQRQSRLRAVGPVISRLLVVWAIQELNL